MTAPIIVKRKKVSGGEGHHGGAWKVAYADFVTAMMAFFLLMWLLNATTEEQRKGLADYFDPTVPISPVSGGGTDVLSGDSVFTTEALARSARGGTSGEAEALASAARDALSSLVEEGLAKVTLSDEGVVVDLIDAEGAPLFALGGAAASDLLGRIMKDVTPVLSGSGRPVRFVGHTDALQFRTGAYTNWELSADRANAARRLAVSAGLSPDAIAGVSGRADRQPITPDASAPENRRISIILLDAPGPPDAQDAEGEVHSASKSKEGAGAPDGAATPAGQETTASEASPAAPEAPDAANEGEQTAPPPNRPARRALR